VKCPECVKNGLRSKVWPGAGTVTLMGWRTYYDEEGLFHVHDPNKYVMKYSCSNGHKWKESTLKPCINCDYGKET